MPTAEMAADSLTKGIGANRLPHIRDDLKLIENGRIIGMVTVVDSFFFP